MVEIKPIRKISGELVTSIGSKQLDFQHSNLDDLFDKFVIFIDGSPNTVRTYRTSLKQWFIYMKEKGITHPDPDTVRQYREFLKASGKKPTTIQNYIVAVKRFFEWTEEEHLYPNIARYVKSAKSERQNKLKSKGEPCENFVILLRKRLGLNKIKHFTLI